MSQQKFEFESDWKLFRRLLPGWQERFMAKLNREYAELLAEDRQASDIFWELDKRMREDKRKAGVVVRDMSRSNMDMHIMNLLSEGAITLDDLSEFSEEYRGRIELIMSRWG